MFPEQQNQNGGQPQPSYQPQSGGATAPVAGDNGQYQVVPPIQALPNTGHSGHNPYEFIVNPAATKKPGKLGGDPFIRKIVVLVGGAVLVMVVLAVIISAVAPKSASADLSGIAETQAELVRVATEGSNQAASQDTKNFVANLQLSITSDQTATLAYLAAHGTKLGAKDLALKQNAQTDTLLTNAQATNTYDTALMHVLNSALTTYQANIQTAFKATNSADAKKLLQADYKNAGLLVEQAKNVQANS